MQEIALYSSGIGINNKVPAHRLPFGEGGVSAFEEAENVLVGRSGDITTKRGTSQEESGSYHSLFPAHKTWGLVAKNRTSDCAIYRVDVDNTGAVTLLGIRSGLAQKKVDFCSVNGVTFYTNGAENGMIDASGVSSVWYESTWPDDRTIVGFTTPPPAEHLCYNAGRIYFSLNNVLYYTEYGHLGTYDPAINGEQLPTRITLIAPAMDGLYVSDEEAVYFLSGLNPHEWTSKKVCDYPANEWGKYHGTVDPSQMGIESNVPSSLIATVNGPVLCMPSGQVINLIDKQVTMPECPHDGAIFMINESLIIQAGE